MPGWIVRNSAAGDHKGGPGGNLPAPFRIDHGLVNGLQIYAKIGQFVYKKVVCMK